MSHPHHPSETAHFDQRAETWDDEPGHVERAEAIAAAVVDVVPLRATDVAMEFGAGTGLLGLRLAAEVAELDLIDLSPGMVAVAQRRAAAHPGVRALVADVGAGEAPRPHYDLITASLALHHVPDVDGLLDRFATLLAPDGWLAVAEMAHDPDGRFHAHLADFAGHAGFDPDDLIRRLRRRGFRDLSARWCYRLVRRIDDADVPYDVHLITGRAG